VFKTPQLKRKYYSYAKEKAKNMIYERIVKSSHAWT